VELRKGATPIAPHSESSQGSKGDSASSKIETLPDPCSSINCDFQRLRFVAYPLRVGIGSTMKKKVVWLTLLLLLVTGGFTHAQQQKKIPRIGILLPNLPAVTPQLLKAFQQGLRELGYVEGENIVIEYRFGEGKSERYPYLATELVQLKVDVIVTSSTPAIESVKNATSTIPIVMAASAEPVGSGLIASLDRPGGNITGSTMLSPELSGKRLELLKETVPRLSRVAVLWNPRNISSVASWRESQLAAVGLKIRVQSIEVRSPSDFHNLSEALSKARFQALNVVRDPLISAHLTRVVEFAAKSRLPTIYEAEEFVNAGGLMSYGTSHPDLYRRAASYVDKILKGAKPADLPVEQPMKFELVINLKTAKQIGLTIPQSVLYRADKVIK
jgi:putative tryptophan/tyrosine transport system substrate-binding protein